MNALLGRIKFNSATPIKAHLRARSRGKQLQLVHGGGGLALAKFVLILVVKNEKPRMKFLLDYYRHQGVEHAIVIDNESTDGLQDFLTTRGDVTIFRAAGSYADARYGCDWVNAILRRHCVGKWVLYVDADEFLVVDAPGKSLASICSQLEMEGSRSLQTVMIDMYSLRQAADNIVSDGQDPLEVCNLYDRTGYDRRYEQSSCATWIKGGVRGRVFFPNLWEGPALNKTPLILWGRFDVVLRSTHLLWPRRLNGVGKGERGALLHFKFTSSNTARMIDAKYRAQHTSEYEAYDQANELILVGAQTATYTDPSDLVAAGIIRAFPKS